MSALALVTAPNASLVDSVAANPAMVLTDQEQFDRFYAEMKRETDAHVPDLSTEKGRKAIASLAFKVARTKTAIDDAGKRLNEDARAQIGVVDEARRRIRSQMDALKDEVRAPLTAWETAEEDRLAKVEASLSAMRAAGMIAGDDSLETLAERMAWLTAQKLDPDLFLHRQAEAEATRTNALAALQAAHTRAVQAEADRVELERLRAAEEARIAKEREEAAAAAERERVAAEAREAEERAAREVARAEAEAVAQQERVRAAAAAAEQVAREAAERQAQEAAAAAERAHEAALAAERRRADEAEAAQRREAEQAARAERERHAEEARQREAEEARQADRQHRSAVMATAKSALIAGADVSEEQAKKIILAIVAGEIPAVTLRF